MVKSFRYAHKRKNRRSHKAMPETEFEDIDVVLERIIDLAREERGKNELQEPSTVYDRLNMDVRPENESAIFSPKMT